jgi:hypothetical protein
VRALAAALRGPVLFCALRRLAAIFAAEATVNARRTGRGHHRSNLFYRPQRRHFQTPWTVPLRHPHPHHRPAIAAAAPHQRRLALPVSRLTAGKIEIIDVQCWCLAERSQIHEYLP